MSSINISYCFLPQAVDLIGRPGQDETQDKNSSHFDRLYFGFPYQTTHLYNEKKTGQAQTLTVILSTRLIISWMEMFLLIGDSFDLKKNEKS